MKTSVILLSLIMLASCASNGQVGLKATSRPVNLERFMGDWYVVGFIPIDNLLISEAGAHNAIESYVLAPDGRIKTTYSFRDGAFEGPLREYHPTGFVHDRITNAEWRMQFLWPFKSAYLIAHVDETYSSTIIGVPDRSNVWLMTRTPNLSQEAYMGLLGVADGLGFDVSKIKRVPHSWPDNEGAP
jgi:apolipoprotein D and lipocalin family protein